MDVEKRHELTLVRLLFNLLIVLLGMERTSTSVSKRIEWELLPVEWKWL